MKVIVPVMNDNTLKNNVADSFHNAIFSCIYDSENNNFEWLSTDEITSKPGNLSLALKQRGVFTIISKSMSLMALGLFKESGLQVFKAEKDTVHENINLFTQQKLKPLSVGGLLEMDGCSSGTCSSCSSTCN